MKMKIVQIHWKYENTAFFLVISLWSVFFFVKAMSHVFLNVLNEGEIQK